MANEDRISEVYKREIWSRANQNRARARVDWLVSHARGDVLDVGCSQGIASVLAARAGCRVTGVDVEAARIEYAQRDRDLEPEDVRDRLRFVHADATRLPVADAVVDVVLVGEVIEHLEDPGPLLGEVARVLRPGGTVALTTPFGYSPHHDHHRTYYLVSLLDVVGPHLLVTDVEVVDGYLRVLATAGTTGTERASQVVHDLLPVLEHRFEQSERQAREVVLKARDLQRDLEKESAAGRERLVAAQEAQASEQQARDELERLRRLHGDELAAHEERLAAVGTELAAVRSAMVRLEDDLTSSEVRRAGVQEELTQVRQNARRRVREVRQRADAVQSQLESEVAAAALAEWQLHVMRQGRYHRARRAIIQAGRDPRALTRLPATLLQITRHPVPVPPRPSGAAVRSRGSAFTAPRDDRATPATPGTPAARRTRAESAVPAVPSPEGRRVRPDLRVATILDPFSAMAFGYEWNQVEVGPDDWREVLEPAPPHLLFVESAWRGNDGRWSYAMTAQDAPKQALRELVAWCRDAGIPTVFWNKEDPPNYERFIETARLFDRVFTVDEDCVARYRDDLGHDRVGVLPFAAQPRIHNPVSVPGGRSGGVAFAGTYFAEKHAGRRDQMDAVLEPARDFGLDIYSRMQGQDQRYQFPPPLDRHVVGSLPYEQMLGAYKQYKVFLNVNSVSDSATMCARRVFELSASATPVVSGPSRAVEATFPGLVSMTSSPETTRETLSTLLANPELRDRIGTRAVREVMSKHTFGHRVDAVLESVGLPQTAVPRAVTVVVPTNRPGMLENVLANVARQGCEALQLVLVAHGFQLDEPGVRRRAEALGLADVVLRHASTDLTLGACMNLGIDAADGDYLAKMDDDNHYGANFLTDQLDAFRYTDAGVVGKWAHYVYLESERATLLRFARHEHRYTEKVQGGTMLIQAEVAKRLRFDDVPRAVDTTFLNRCAREGVQVYSGDRFNFVSVRRSDPHSHTWTITDRQILARSSELKFFGDPEEHVSA